MMMMMMIAVVVTVKVVIIMSSILMEMEMSWTRFCLNNKVIKTNNKSKILSNNSSNFKTFR